MQQQLIDIHKHVLTDYVALGDALHTKSPLLCNFTGITSFLLSNVYLAYCYFKDKTMSHTNFKILNFTSNQIILHF